MDRLWLILLIVAGVEVLMVGHILDHDARGREHTVATTKGIILETYERTDWTRDGRRLYRVAVYGEADWYCVNALPRDATAFRWCIEEGSEFERLIEETGSIEGAIEAIPSLREALGK